MAFSLDDHRNPNIERVARLKNIIRFIRRELDGEVSLHHLDLFLTIAAGPGINTNELVEEIGSSQSVISRSIRVLSTYLREPTREEAAAGKQQVRDGCNLVRSEPCLHNRRVLAYFPTADGYSFLAEIEKLLRGAPLQDAKTNIPPGNPNTWRVSSRPKSPE